MRIGGRFEKATDITREDLSHGRWNEVSGDNRSHSCGAFWCAIGRYCVSEKVIKRRVRAFSSEEPTKELHFFGETTAFLTHVEGLGILQIFNWM